MQQVIVRCICPELKGIQVWPIRTIHTAKWQWCVELCEERRLREGPAAPSGCWSVRDRRWRWFFAVVSRATLSLSARCAGGSSGAVWRGAHEASCVQPRSEFTVRWVDRHGCERGLVDSNDHNWQFRQVGRPTRRGRPRPVYRLLAGPAGGALWALIRSSIRCRTASPRFASSACCSIRLTRSTALAGCPPD